MSTKATAQTFPNKSTPHNLVEGRLNVPAFLRWVNARGEFCIPPICIRDAMLVGVSNKNRNEVRVILLLEHTQLRLVAASPFDFHEDVLRPFLIPVSK